MNRADFFDGLVNSHELRSFFPQAFAGEESGEIPGKKVPPSSGAGTTAADRQEETAGAPSNAAETNAFRASSGAPAAEPSPETPFQPPAAGTEAGPLNTRGVAVKQAPRIIF
ncbi:MAG: hypothetical protein LBQ14_08500 [Treponema sp.]|jgi:hypothetical protein|nr:hypothetical protein [Treponema sp.]